MDDGADRLLAGWNAREPSGVKKPMRTLKWMTIFASLAAFSQAVQAQGQSGRVDITGDTAVEIAVFFEEDRSELYYFIADKRSRARTQLFFFDLPDAVYDLTGAWLADQQTGERIAVTAGGSYTFQPLGKESSFVFVIE
jgi:predicted RNase H-like nuclease